MANKVPRIKFEIDPNDSLQGVKVISLVDQPAIESDFIFFNKSKGNFVELKGEQYKQVVAGLALIPDKDILRFDAQGEPFYGYFSKDVIENIRNKFHKEQLTSNVNTDHNANNYVDAFLIESFIIDSEERLADVKAKGINEVTLGSWFVSYKIEDKEIFERVVSGELKGFSVEIFLSKFYKQGNNFNNIENVMNGFLEKFKTLLAEFEKSEVKEEVKADSKKFERAKSGDLQIEYGIVGEPVSIVTVAEDGTESLEPAKDETYILDNGFSVTVASGVATEIVESPVEQKKEEPKADEQFNAVKTELEKVKEDLKKANEQIEKLKKAPLANPVVKTELKKSKVLSDEDFNKLSNVDKILYKKGLLN